MGESHDRDGGRRLTCRRRRLVGRLACLAAVGMAAAGCSDPRIGIYEFIELQQQFAQTPTSQPNIEASEEWIDRSQRPYRVGPGDVLSIAMRGLNDPMDFTVIQKRVSRGGDIELPIVGSVKINDLETEDVEETIRDRYVPGVSKSMTVHVDVVMPRTTDVLVVGAVATPGLVPLQRNERDVLHAVALAGGLSSQASGRMMLRRMRRPGEEVTLDLLDPIELDAALALDPLEPGDTVTVEASFPTTVFVGGLVNAPGPQGFAPGAEMNLLQVFAAAGGVQEDVFPREATLIRRMPDGSDVQVKLDLDKLKNGEHPNIALAAGDILWVPETFGTRVMDFINQTIFFRAGFTASYNVSGSATGFERLNRRGQAFNNANVTPGTTLQNQVDPLGFLVPPAP